MRRVRYSYRIVNVFTGSPFSGKAVAVFSNAAGLSTGRMETVARELRLPQCAFIFPPEENSGLPRVRVFTPAVELPRSGLPMIAVVFAMHLDQGSELGAAMSGPDRVVLKHADEPVSVAVSAQVFTVRQDVPAFTPGYPERETVAALLSLRPDQLGASPLEVGTSGDPYLLVPVKHTQVLAAARLRESIWERTLRNFTAPNVVLFALRDAAPGALAHLRVFTPAFGVAEEAATESAAGPLLGYLLRHRLVDLPKTHVVALHQGEGLGRPSVLHCSYERSGDELVQLRVGGQCVIVGEGSIYV